MKKIVNLTPHPLVYIPETGLPREIPASGIVVRAVTVSKPAGSIDGIPVITMTHGEVEGLPAPSDNTIFLVSSIAAEGISKERNDVYVPTDFVRDEKGNIIGFRVLGCLA